jgi:Amt family ammonium transporter
MVFLDLTPSSGWLSPGDTGWQLTSATLVGLMSVPGLAILYSGLMKRKWALNSALMVLYAFAMTLVVWSLWGYSMSFGKPIPVGPGFLGIPWPVVSAAAEQGRASIPLLNGLIPKLQFPGSALIYFQFVFAAITVIILGGSMLGRLSIKAWMLFVPLWITFVYSVGAFMLWGGGWLAQMGAVDYSGGYVIHVAAGISGVVGAAVIGPRLQKDRVSNPPSNLIFAIVGGGLLWLGWNGFNGGDPYFANADAGAAVINTNIAAATALLAWMFMDVFLRGKPQVSGMINGMVAGLVAITPAAGYVPGWGALIIGVAAGTIPWITMNRLAGIGFLKRIDDTLGVMHTHLVAGALGGLLTGLLASPAVIVYTAKGKTSPFAVTGLFFGNPRQFFVQLFALIVILVYDGVATFVVLKVVGLIVPLRMSDDELEGGDAMIHGEVAWDDGTPMEQPEINAIPTPMMSSASAEPAGAD